LSGRPSGGVPNPLDPTGVARISDAAVVGLTTTIKY
jgi:porin